MAMENTNVTGMSVTTWILWSFVSILVGYVVLDLYKKRHLLKFTRNTGIFQFYPIIGNMQHLIGENLLVVLRKLVKKYKLPFSFWIGHECFYVTGDAEEIKVILNHPQAFDKNIAYASFNSLFENSLILAKYEEWKRDRKLLHKGFLQNSLNSYVATFYKHSCILVEEINKHQSKNMDEMFNRFSLSSFCANSTGLSDLNDELAFTQLFDTILEIVSSRLFTAPLFPECLWKHTQQGRSYSKNSEMAHQFIKDLIEKKKQHSSINKELYEESNPLSLVDLMLENEDKVYSHEDIYKQLCLLVLAATDTTGKTVALTLTMLGMNPNVQEKVYEEVIRTIGRDGPINHDHLPKLKYTDRVISETLRLLPVIPLIGRLASADIDLGKKLIPARTHIVLDFFHLHRSEKYWTNPLEYDPDRFLPEEVAKRPPYTYLPFAGGPRICLGMKYAMMAAKTAVAHVIRNYKVTSSYKSVEDIKLVSGITLQPLDLDYTFVSRKW